MNKVNVKHYVKQQIHRIENMNADGPRKAELAKLRNGIGKTPGNMPELWGMFLKDLPMQELAQAKEYTPSNEEWAIYTALTLFALHQQGNDIKTNCMNSEEIPLGIAIGRLALPGDDDKEDRIRNRFNQMATSSDLLELSHYLRGIIQLLRADNIKLDYGALAQDLLYYQNPNARDGVRLKWGRDFYRGISNKL